MVKAAIETKCCIDQLHQVAAGCRPVNGGIRGLAGVTMLLGPAAMHRSMTSMLFVGSSQLCQDEIPIPIIVASVDMQLCMWMHK